LVFVDLNVFLRAILVCTGFGELLFSVLLPEDLFLLVIEFRCTLLINQDCTYRSQIYLIEYIFTDANFYMKTIL